MKFENMFKPIQIGPMTVKNRFVVPPMGNNFANADGCWSDQSVAYYAERAKGQFGLVTIEATVVHKGAKGGPRKPCLYDESSIASLKKITDACHAKGAKVSIQLQNAGPEGNAKNAGAPIQAATAIPSTVGRDTPEEVPTAQVYELVEGYAEAARRAMEGGADAVEIHMAHGYLVSSFMSPRTNKRVDEFKEEDGNLYAIYGTPAENLCGLQIRQFREQYGIIEGVSDRPYVSNSFHCHVSEDITPIQKQDLENRFWNLSNGGKIQYVKYPIGYNTLAIKSLIRRAMDMGFYEGVNLSLSYCDDCGHEELQMDVCPKCGSKNLTKIDRMNGYLSYSRVHGDTRLNAAKMAEIADRKSM